MTDEEKKDIAFQVIIDKSVKEALKEYCKDNGGVSISYITQKAIEEYLKTKGL